MIFSRVVEKIYFNIRNSWTFILLKNFGKLEMLIYYLKRIFASYNIVLIVFGSIGNLLTCFICLKKNMRSIPTFKLYAFNSVFDVLSLYPWNVSQFFGNFLRIELGKNLIWCMLANFLQYSAYEISAWFLVIFFTFYSLAL